MKPTRLTPLLVTFGGVALLSWGGLRWWVSSGHELPTLPWSAPAVMLLLALAVLAVGWPVRRWKTDRDRPLDPLRAARTVVLAKAAQHSGALLVGWYAGQALVLAPTADVEPRRGLLVRAVLSLLAAVAVGLVGWWVERWCRVDRSPDDPAGGVS